MNKTFAKAVIVTGFFIGAACLVVSSNAFAGRNNLGTSGSVLGDCNSCSLDASLEENDYPCLEVIEVAVGGSLPMRLVRNGTVLPSGVGISPEFGDVDSLGIYHAPTELTPAGLDIITLSDAVGVPFAKMVVQLVPTGGFVPNSQVSSPVQPSEMTLEESVETEASYQVGTSAQEITRPSQEVIMPTQQIQGLSGQFAPLMKLDADGPVDFDSDDALVLLNSETKRGKKCGVFPAPTGSCSNGQTKVVAGPWKIHKKGSATDIATDLSGGSVSVTVHYYKMVAWKVKYKDYYRCENGSWKFVRTEKCTLAGAFAWAFDPQKLGFMINGTTVVRIILGYDINGYKFDSTPECVTVP